MICKFCNQEVVEGFELCPVCGQKLKQEEIQEAVIAETTAVEQPTTIFTE